MTDELFIQRCIMLAEKGYGKVSPNPLVGCVIADKHGTILSEGYHHGFGKPHAEVEAIHAIKDKSVLSEAIMYVNLEPCSHFGKTPPCADLIISHGIKKVIIGTRDPNPVVMGKGMEKLTNAGISVTCGVLEDKCRKLNAGFFSAHEKKRPYFILKWAETANGKLGNNTYNSLEERQISNKVAHILAHKWRAGADAIVIGINTYLTDKPKLTTRLFSGKNPVIFLLDPNSKYRQENSSFEKESLVVVMCNKDAKSENHTYINTDFSKWDKQLTAVMNSMQIQYAMVEGGASTLSYFIKQKLWDECRVFRSNNSMMWSVNAPHIPGTLIEEITIGNNHLLITENR